MKDKRIIGGHLVALITEIMWGATFVSTKVMVQYFLPVEVLIMRVVLALIVMFLVYPKRTKVGSWKRELMFLLAGLTGIVFYFMLENTALTYTYASIVGIIVACAPFFVAVLVGIFFKSEKLTPFFFLGFAFSITGIVMISLNGQKSLGISPLGALLAVLAMVSWGFYSVIVKKIESWDYNVIMVTRRIYAYALIFLIPIALFEHATLPFKRLTDNGVWLHILFLGVCGSALGFMLWNLATKWIGAIKTSVYIYVSPVVTLLLSVIVLHEKLTLISIAGSCLIFIGLIIAQRFK